MEPSRIELLQSKLASIKKPAVARPTIFSGSIWKDRAIKETEEFKRIYNIERRDWEPTGLALAEELTPLLRTREGAEVLRPVQAVTLHDLYLYGGAIAIVRVGGGKSLITFLAPYVVRAFRPLLLVPGNLLEKTRRHMLRDSHNWEIPNFIRVESYELLSNPNHTHLLYKYMPDLIMIDEASRCKNTRAVVTKRIKYYLGDIRRGYYETGHGRTYEQHALPEGITCKMLALSGTLTNRSVFDYWHILRWVLPRERVPLPLSYEETEEWSLALDVKVGELHRIKPGALLKFCDEEDLEIAQTNPIKAARRGYRKRLLSVPGIISTQTPFLGCSLRFSAIEVKAPQAVQDAFKKLRKWKLPDGREIQDAHVAAARAKEISLGLFHYWDPPPPKEYVKAHQEWGKACRKIITDNKRRLDSEGQVIKAMTGPDAHYPEHLEKLQNWKRWHKEFGEPNVKAFWISDYAVKFAAEWMKNNPRGIVWVMHVALGEKLSEYTGVSYYGEQSTDKNGRFIENHPHGTPMIASIPANYQGKNLQFGWNRNLIMHALSSGEWYEQLTGRTHRELQPEDEVTVEFFASCLEHYRAFWNAVEDADFSEDMESARKLMYADVDVPTLKEIADRYKGELWEEGQML